jgi:chaperonin GroEL
MAQARLMFEPEARAALQRGFHRLAAAMEVTLGPRGRLVAMSRDNRRRAPELLNDGATIARRFLGLPNRFETMGAFLARHIAWQVEELVGDGTTTAVVIARHILDEVNRLAAAGHNVMTIRRGLEKATAHVAAELEKLAQPLETPEQVRILAASITGNEELGRLTAEVFDVVGPYGAVDVRHHYGRDHAVRYINGAFWNQGWFSSHFTTDGGAAVVKEPYLLLTDRHLQTAEELLPLLEQARPTGRGLVVIATSVAGDALNLLVTNQTRGALPTLAIKAPGLGSEKTEILQDLAALTGGRVFLAGLDERIQRATLADLGQAREVQAIRSGFTIVGGKGRPAAIRQRSQTLRSQVQSAPYGRERNRLIERAGKLLGGVALLEVGGAVESERDYLKERAKEAVHVVRLGMQNGVVPGGGAAYLRCATALERLYLTDEEAVAATVLRGALEAPMAALVRNAGIEPAPVLAAIRRQGNNADRSGWGYDVLAEQVRDMAQAHIVDPVTVARAALEAGVSGALMGLTTDVLVHKPRRNRDREVDFRP